MPGDGVGDGLRWQLADWLSELAANPAPVDTDTVTIGTRDGPGLETGTRFRAAQRFPDPRYRTVVYRYAGADGSDGRDRREVGLVFDVGKRDPFLVALYEDAFSAH